MAVKCILTGQTPSVLDGVTENVQTQLNDKVDKVTGKGLSTNDYTSAEKTKLSGIETGAQKNTITGVKGSAETTYRTGNVNITATNIGLGNVNNTSDAEKPISTATKTALDGKQAKVTGAATTITDSNLTADRVLISNSSGKVAVSSVTSTELGYLDGVTSNIQTQLNNKLSSAPVTSVNNKTGAVSLKASDVGLGNVDNTSDANKPISNATQAALNDKQTKITASGLLKGDGAGGVSAAVKGTDYFTPTDVNEIAAEAAKKVDVSGKLDKTGDGSNVTAAFTAASTRANVATGEKLSVLFGKVAKWFADLGSLAFKSTVAKSDLASDVQASLGKADSALQNYTETDPTVPAWAKSETKPTYTASEVGALPANTHIPSTVAEMSDAGNYALKSDLTNKVSKSGDTMTGKLTVPQVETGTGNSNFFQCRKFRGEGNADTYYHAIDFGYQNHDRVDFHEYGGIWSFYKNQTGKANDGVLCGKITINGWEGRAKLESGSTMVTSQLTENSNAIATTAFVHGLVDGLKSKGVSVTLPASGWNANAKTQTVSVSGVTATANCIITAAPDSYMAYAKAGVRCTAQGAGTLTFACETVPTANVAANVLIVG